MRLGIGSYTYVWAVGVPGYPAPAEPLTALEIIDQAVELGVRVVQIADNLPLHTQSPEKLDELLRRAGERNIVLEVGTSGIDAENLSRYLGIARRLHSRILRTVIDTATDRPSPGEVVARLAPLMIAFERAGVTLALENHDHFKATTLLDIVNRLGSRHVGVCLDTANSLGCMEGPEHIVATLGARVVNLHIKDVCVFRPPHHKGFVVEGRPAGQGQLDLPAILRGLRERGADPNAIVELWPPPEPEIADAVAKENAWARQSIGYVRTLIPD
jgi:sugar phosphate isomerase/epimerase